MYYLISVRLETPAGILRMGGIKLACRAVANEARRRMVKTVIPLTLSYLSCLCVKKKCYE